MCPFSILNINDWKPNILLYSGKLLITIQSSNLIAVECVHQMSGKPQDKVTIYVTWIVEARLERTECASPVILRTCVSGIEIKGHASLILGSLLSLASGPVSRPPRKHRSPHFLLCSASSQWKSGTDLLCFNREVFLPKVFWNIFFGRKAVYSPSGTD